MINPYSTWPLVIPAGWQTVDRDGLKTLYRHFPNGLFATFAIETYPGGGGRHTLGPCEEPGTFRRIVISRKKMYPAWDEMRDLVRTCGLFDRSRDIFMVIPPDEEYVNLHPHAFHWWQKERS